MKLEPQRPPLLLVDAYLSEEGAAPSFLPALGAHTLVWRAAHEPLPASAKTASGIVISGSAASVQDEPEWLAPLEQLVRDAVLADRPVLGICFGHQVLARAMLGPEAVRPAAAPGELGWIEIERRGDDALLDALPRRFRCFASHSDELVPTDQLELLATSPACEVEAFRLPGRRAWGVQFHPEMGEAEAEELVRTRAAQKGLDAEAILAAPRSTPDLCPRVLRRFRELIDESSDLSGA